MKHDWLRTNFFKSLVKPMNIEYSSMNIMETWRYSRKWTVRASNERSPIPSFLSVRLGFSRWHYNAPFSTHDHYATDHTNCPQSHGGAGWWYHFGHDCAHVQLNGQIPTHSDGLVPLNTGIVWLGWKSDRHYSFQRVHMAIQRKFKPAPLPHHRH
jgi:hypothetical protein